MATTDIESIANHFTNFTNKPTKFLKVQKQEKEPIKKLIKSLYDFTKLEENTDPKSKGNAISELIIDDFDEEQIWQQIELQNTEKWDGFVWDVANFMNDKNLKFPVEVSPENPQSNEDIDDDDDNESEDQEPIEDEKQIKKKTKSISKAKKSSKNKSIVDDKFFKLHDMEQFLLKEEKMDGKQRPRENDSDDESIDMFEDIEDDDEGDEENRNDAMYADFFDDEEDQQNDQEMEEIQSNSDRVENSDVNLEAEDDDIEQQRNTTDKKKKKKVSFAGLDSESNSEDDQEQQSSRSEDEKQSPVNTKSRDEKKSEFELRQQRLKQTIDRLEGKTLSEAPWQLKGEVDASKRPQNSLLQEVVDFDLTSRPPPLITEQTTVTLEELIKRRIKDKAWDDVTKKEKPVDDSLLFRKPEVLDHSKSKLSLAQVYEAEYLKQKHGNEEVDEKEPENHTQIRDAMKKLFSKLDAMSNCHFTPKAPQADVKIVSNAPAITMEEVAPVATSNAALLAPEEVKCKNRGDLVSKEERTATDKKRERRKKKKLQKLKGHVEKVTNNRHTTKGVEASDKSLKTSKAFFQQLNDDATSLIKNKNSKRKNKGQ